MSGKSYSLKPSGKPNRHPSFVPTGRIWPSGDFSLGFQRVSGDSGVDGRSFGALAQAESFPLPGDDGWFVGRWGVPQPVEGHRSDGQALMELDAEECHQNPAGYAVAYGVEFDCGRLVVHLSWLVFKAAKLAFPLDLTVPVNSHNGASRCEKYGKGGITSYGRKMVKSAATLIQKMPGKRATFATVTMPTLPPDLRRELALAWPELLRQMLQWLSRQLKKSGLPGLVCSVTEVQPGRLVEHKEAYLHLHLVWPNHGGRYGEWAVDCVALRAWCSEFLQRRGIWVADAWVNVDVQQVKKTAAGYLSKYMSKGASEIEEFAKDCGWDAIPGQWWNLTKPARDMVKKFIHEGHAVGLLIQAVVQYSLELCDLSPFWGLNAAILTIGGKECQVGWYGGFKEEFRLELIRMLKAAA